MSILHGKNFFEGRNFGENVSEIECTYLVLGGAADVVVALGTGESVELDLEGPRLLRLSEFGGRRGSKKSGKSEKVDQNRKIFNFSKVVKMSKFGCLEYKSGLSRKKSNFDQNFDLLKKVCFMQDRHPPLCRSGDGHPRGVSIR